MDSGGGTTANIPLHRGSWRMRQFSEAAYTIRRYVGSTDLREYNVKIRRPRFHLARRKTDFAIRSAGPLNRLPQCITEGPTVSSFKGRLDVD